MGKLKGVIDKFPFKIEEVRTDNGLQFTNRLISKNRITLFEKYFKEKNKRG